MAEKIAVSPEDWVGKAEAEFVAVLRKAHQILDLEREGWGASLEPVQLEIKNIGRAAGRTTDTTIALNSQLADHPWRETAETLRHEMAHVITEAIRKRIGPKRRSPPWNAHGPVWKRYARALGGDADRCHHLNLNPTRRLRRFLYNTECGTHSILFSTVRHNRAQRARAMGLRGYSVNGQALRFQFEVEQSADGKWQRKP